MRRTAGGSALGRGAARSLPPTGSRFRAALLVAAGWISACSVTTGRGSYSVGALREELARRAPRVPPEARLVPFAVEAQQVEAARAILRPARNDAERAHLLLRALQGDGPLGLTYSRVGTTTAAEALRRGSGNCMAIASVVVGLARALGLASSYVLFAGSRRETQQLDDLVVDTGHIGAVIQTQRGVLGFDIGPNRLAAGNWRAIDDLEATALFYNNRGFERLAESLTAGDPPPWEAARLSFWIATRAFPGSAEAANNLGVASARLGREAEAALLYRRASRLDPEAAAPLSNLASLHLRRGRPGDAVEELRRAVDLAEDRVDLAYRYGLALLQTGDHDLGLKVLRQAAARDPSPSRAQELLRHLAPQPKSRLSAEPRAGGS